VNIVLDEAICVNKVSVDSMVTETSCIVSDHVWGIDQVAAGEAHHTTHRLSLADKLAFCEWLCYSFHHAGWWNALCGCNGVVRSYHGPVTTSSIDCAVSGLENVSAILLNPDVLIGDHTVNWQLGESIPDRIVVGTQNGSIPDVAISNSQGVTKYQNIFAKVSRRVNIELH